MRVWMLTLMTGLLGFSLFASPVTLKDVFHKDYRSFRKLSVQPESLLIKSNAHSILSVKDFLVEKGDVYGVVKNPRVELKKIKVKQSLRGFHHHFQQYVDGVQVDGGQLVVTTDSKKQTVLQVYSNLHQFKIDLPVGAAFLSDGLALQRVWSDLKVSGKLLDTPNQKKVFRVNQKGQARLVVIARVAVTAPFGDWEYELDAFSGKILSKENKILDLQGFTNMKAEASVQKTLSPLVSELKRFQNQKKNIQKLDSMADAFVDGMGLVFDPDPLSLLNGDGTLTDKSDASEFEFAYEERELKDITINEDGEFQLIGRWVTLADFETPDMKPSTTADGSWMGKRGNTSFNDAMTYYHLDANQRYMQSLGFTGDKGIQNVSIEVDANGVQGADNSHFIPSTNQLAFGHGCVDDNEDADVILHEYGHAINHFINENWRGGDTGAMGEGFGDYWAGAYSLRKLGLENVNTDKVFNWDGSDGCWAGRRLNAVGLKYDKTKTYRAHERLEGGVSDELWSTPLFEALKELVSMKIPQDQVDQIILEAQFGLGQGLTMNDMARMTVKTARELYPDQPHARVFLKHFVNQGIMETPSAVLSLMSVEVLDQGGNQFLDPGESAKLNITLSNTGTLDLEKTEAELVIESDSVTIEQSKTTFSSLMSGSSSTGESSLEITLSDDVACGETIPAKIVLSMDSQVQSNREIPLTLKVGKSKSEALSFEGEVMIPDNTMEGVQVEVEHESAGTISGNVRLKLDISHTYIRDTLIWLTAPSGKTIKLWSRKASTSAGISGEFPTNLTPAESLDGLIGEPLNGTWTLKVVDAANRDVGTVNSFSLEAETGVECQ